MGLSRCVWQGQECDVDESFKTTLTDLGVCYTFNNYHNGESLTVTEAGELSYTENHCMNLAGADLEFTIGGVPTLQRGRQHTILPNYHVHLHKIGEIFGSKGQQ